MPTTEASTTPTPYSTLSTRTLRRMPSSDEMSMVGGICAPHFRFAICDLRFEIDRKSAIGNRKSQHSIHFTQQPFRRDQENEQNHRERRVPQRLAGLDRDLLLRTRDQSRQVAGDLRQL